MFASSSKSADKADGIKGSVVLGIDPGLTRCGYAVLEVQGATQISMLALGVLRTSPDHELIICWISTAHRLWPSNTFFFNLMFVLL